MFVVELSLFPSRTTTFTLSLQIWCCFYREIQDCSVSYHPASIIPSPHFFLDCLFHTVKHIFWQTDITRSDDTRLLTLLLKKSQKLFSTEMCPRLGMDLYPRWRWRPASVVINCPVGYIDVLPYLDRIAHRLDLQNKTSITCCALFDLSIRSYHGGHVGYIIRMRKNISTGVWHFVIRSTPGTIIAISRL